MYSGTNVGDRRNKGNNECPFAIEITKLKKKSNKCKKDTEYLKNTLIMYGDSLKDNQKMFKDIMGRLNTFENEQGKHKEFLTRHMEDEELHHNKTNEALVRLTDSITDINRIIGTSAKDSAVMQSHIKLGSWVGSIVFVAMLSMLSKLLFMNLGH
jgi:gas vesicle protein